MDALVSAARQGLKVEYTHCKVWTDGALNSIVPSRVKVAGDIKDKKPRAKYDVSVSEIVDLQLCKSKSVFTSSISEYGYYLESFPVDKTVFMAYIRKEEVMGDVSGRGKATMFKRATRKLKGGPKWTPQWITSTDSIDYLTHVAICYRGPRNVMDGFTVIAESAPAGDTVDVDLGGTGVLSYIAYRKAGRGPAISGIRVLETLEDPCYFTVLTPVNYEGDSSRHLGFQLNLEPIAEAFGDSKLDAYVVSMLYAVYSNSAEDVASGVDALSRLVGVFKCASALEQVSGTINECMLQLIELLTTLFIRGCRETLLVVSTILVDMVVACKDVVKVDTIHAINACLINTMTYDDTPIKLWIDTVATFKTGKKGYFTIARTKRAPSTGGIGTALAKSKDGIVGTAVTELVANVEANSIVKDLSSSIQNGCLPSSLELVSTEEHKLFISTIASLCQTIRQSCSSVTMGFTESELDTLRMEYSAHGKANAIASGARKSALKTVMMDLVVEGNPIWNAYSVRKQGAISILKDIISRTETCYTNNDGHINPMLVCVLRTLVVPSLMHYLWFSITSQSTLGSSFHIGLEFFCMLWGSRLYRGVLRDELALVWDKLLLGVLRDEVNIKERVFDVALVRTKEQLKSNGESKSKSRVAKLVKKLVEERVLSIKIEVLECVCQLLKTCQDSIDTYFFMDLGQGNVLLFENTVEALCRVCEEFNFCSVNLTMLNNPQADEEVGLILSNSMVFDESDQSIQEDEKSLRGLFKRSSMRTSEGSIRTMEDDDLEDMDMDDYNIFGEGVVFTELADELGISFATMVNGAEQLALSAMFLLANVLHQFAERISCDEEVGVATTRASTLRYEAMQISASGQFAEALCHIIHFYEDVNSPKEGIVPAHRRRRANASPEVVTGKSFRVHETTDELLGELSLFIYEALKSSTISCKFAGEFLSGQHLTVHPHLRLEGSDCSLMAEGVMKLILANNFPKYKLECMYSALQCIFSSPWIHPPLDFESRSVLVIAFVSVFEMNGLVQSRAHDQLSSLDMSQLSMLCLAALEGGQECTTVEDIEPTGSWSGFNQDSVKFLSSIKVVGKRLGLITKDKKPTIPKAVIRHFGYNTMSSQTPDSWVASTTTPVSSTEVPTRPRTDSSCGSRLHGEPNLHDALFRILGDASVCRLFNGYDFIEGRSHRLLYHMLEKKWHRVLALLVDTVSQLHSDAWRRDGSIRVISVCMDGITSLLTSSIYLDYHRLTKEAVAELGRIRAQHLYYFERARLEQFMLTDEYLEVQLWIKGILSLPHINKVNTCNQLQYIATATQAELECNSLQNRMTNLHFSGELDLYNQSREIVYSGKVFATEVGKKRERQDHMILMSDVLVVAEETRYNYFNKSIVVHLSLCQVLSIDEAYTCMSEELLGRTLVDYTTVPALVVSSPQSNVVIGFKSLTELEMWKEELEYQIRVNRFQHKELVLVRQSQQQSSRRDSHHDQKTPGCRLCLKLFGNFTTRRHACFKCSSDVCGSCIGEELCHACIVLEALN